ncbi:solute carrier organic anion transporter family member 1B1-like [Dromiciops gliroides]|uniref:solute carrier organic anion transporter family member 1B1-like n=1 Tax=Dromiciops gliroides TaxID=33562 RepID=UPI001CC50488|nr:solute carrier organic anion transporter family member 1B1-like [Dromiciops gliroides]XP_043823252.1 solute carrier organic anion transporter family member 1B1-like [Dromiciops gliroides]XP_043823253.1 solute carrier organic anion transporter family member 1B1-like [Dromiciops gliroides]XP_043823254.1 solute carrier organic anion transporter family member 1B1-like [Dromiciops gliroides]
MDSKKENVAELPDILDSRKDSSQYSAKQTDMRSSGKNKTKCSNGLKMFMVSLCFSFICKALSGIVMKSSITQIERRFGISTSEAGFIDGSFEIGNLLVIIPVSHFGAKSHIPRLIGIGSFVMGIGSLLTALPHFLMGYYRYDSVLNANPLDNSTVTYTSCSTDLNLTGNNRSSIQLETGCKNESDSRMWIYVLMGNMLRGIGEAPIAPLGITYIDNFAKEGHSTFYLGILHSLTMIGPMLGYMLGSLCAKLYVDIGFVDLSTITIKPSDSRWVGAWWLGFLIAGMLNIVAGIPFFFIPKHMKKARRQSTDPAALDAPCNNDNRGQKLNFKNAEQTKTHNSLEGFFYSLKCILSNKMYLFYLVSSLLTFSTFIGNITYLPKFLEQEYDLSMYKSNLFLGTTAIPIVAISVFLGGYISKKLKLGILGNAKLLLISRVIAMVLQIPLYFLYCRSQPIAGLTVNYNGNDTGTLQDIPFSFCNSHCNCDANLWDPVCGDDGLTYMSPCLAGCKSSVGRGKDLVFHNCSCVEVNNIQSGKASAHLGKCSRTDDCSRNFIYFTILSSFISFAIGIGSTSSILLVFKFVNPELKSLAIGVHSLVMRTLGGILAPIYYGLVIDVTCLKWDTNNCGDQGACRIYDSHTFRNAYYGLSVGLKIPDFIFFIILFIAMKKNYQESKTGPSNNEGIDMDGSNNKPLVSSAHADSESHI